MFWITFREGVVKYIVLHVKCSTYDPKSTRLLNLNFSKPITGTLAYEQIYSLTSVAESFASWSAPRENDLALTLIDPLFPYPKPALSFNSLVFY